MSVVKVAVVLNSGPLAVKGHVEIFLRVTGSQGKRRGHNIVTPVAGGCTRGCGSDYPLQTDRQTELL